MSYKITAIILAAGKGTRMKSDLPKVLHPIAGQSMISHVIDAVDELSIDHIVTVISSSQESVKQEVQARHNNADFVIQAEQLGTAHAVSEALPRLRANDDVAVVLYGDTPFVESATIQKMIDAVMADDKSAVVVLGFETPTPGAYGRLVTSGDILTEIVEFKEASDEQRAINLCNSGVMAIRASLADELLSAVDNNNSKGEYYLTDIVAIAKQKGWTSRVIRTQEDEVLGVNSQAERAQAESILQNKLRAKAMVDGVMLIDPSSVMLQKDTRFGRNVIIHPNVVISGGVSIADNVEIKSFSHLEKCSIDNNAIVGPYARLRPGAKLGENVRIGNFVEIKKATISRGAKVNHLSYIGDADVGENTNIGAGVITCNYDGYNKYNTTIEENCFIGSNSSLVAPIKIQQGSIIGAGSTVIKDVPRDSIVINKMPQENRANKAETFREEKKRI